DLLTKLKAADTSTRSQLQIINRFLAQIRSFFRDNQVHRTPQDYFNLQFKDNKYITKFDPIVCPQLNLSPNKELVSKATENIEGIIKRLDESFEKVDNQSTH